MEEGEKQRDDGACTRDGTCAGGGVHAGACVCIYICRIGKLTERPN